MRYIHRKQNSQDHVILCNDCSKNLKQGVHASVNKIVKT